MMKKYIICIPICVALIFLNEGQKALAQQPTGAVKGTLHTTSGTPVAGAKITLVERPAIQVVSNENGTFAIKGEVGQHLEIKKAGANAKKVSIRRDTMKITLKNSSEIPVGYGQYRSPNGITSAVSIVRAKHLPERSSIISSSNMLYGKVPGLIALESVDIPNYRYPLSHATFLVRGRGTFGNSNPLVLVDGFQRTINSVAPEAIESVSVLKDAAATAIYGQRGANGVILITTKHGASHPLKVHASYNQAITRPIGLPNMLGAARYARARNEALANDGLPARYEQGDIRGFDDGSSVFYPNVDWFDRVLRNHGVRTNANITFEGGGERLRYFTLLHYMHDDGIFGPVHRNDGYSTQYKTGQFNFRTNLGIDITDHLLFKVNVSGRVSDLNRPQTAPDNIFNELYSVPSAAFPIKTPNGNSGGGQIYNKNPVAQLTKTGFQSPSFRELILDGKLKRDLNSWVNGLSVEADVSYNNYGSYFENKSKNYRYESISPVRDQGGGIVDTTSTIYGNNSDLNFFHSFVHLVRQSNIVGKMNYHHSFNSSTIKAMLLFDQENRTLDGINQVNRRRNFAGNVRYGFNKTYFVDIAASYSGNNLLAPGNRYNFFPAISAAWLLSNEDFLQDVSFLNRLKLRASWGMSGNDQFSPRNPAQSDPYTASYNYGDGYLFKNNNTGFGGIYERRLPTPNFTVEQSSQTNVGIDARLFGHLSLVADLFYAHRTHIWTDSEGRTSDVIGIAQSRNSNGIVDNKGGEVSLKWQQTIGDATWHIGGQLSYARNEIINNNEQNRRYAYQRHTGRSIGQRFGLQVIGFFQDQQDIENSPKQNFGSVKPGDIKYKDQNNDGTINQYDNIPLGYHSGYPNIYYSFSAGVQFKGITLSALFQGTGQYTAYLNTKSAYWPLRNNNTISSYYYNHRWTPETASSATLPRLTTQNGANNFRPNSIWLRSKSYIKLRYAQLSYSLPASVVQQLHLDNIKIVAQGRNLFSIDDIPVGDPEQFGASYPLMRSYSLGLDIAF